MTHRLMSRVSCPTIIVAAMNLTQHACFAMVVFVPMLLFIVGSVVTQNNHVVAAFSTVPTNAHRHLAFCRASGGVPTVAAASTHRGRTRMIIRNMAAEDESNSSSSSSSTSNDSTAVSPTDATKSMPTSGTYYDDEVDPIPKTKVGISQSMKDRLVREASSGLDSEVKQTNVILYIMATVVVLVLLGGQGILF